MGKIHIDGKLLKATSVGVIARLPDDAPTPLSLVEAGMYIGDALGSVWVNAKSRDIFTNGFPVGKRIVVDLVGVFA